MGRASGIIVTGYTANSSIPKLTITCTALKLKNENTGETYSVKAEDLSKLLKNTSVVVVNDIEFVKRDA